MPIVAPVTSTPLCLAISLPTSFDDSEAPSEQCPVAAAPETQIYI